MSARRRQARQEPPDGETPGRGMESVRRSSSLPSGVFLARSPDVERTLAGEVADVFLRHMAQLDGTRDVHHGEPVSERPGVERDKIDEQDVAALLEELRAAPSEPPPPIQDGVDVERAWILVHLALHGSPTARRAASIELLQLAERDDVERGPEAEVLRALCALIGDAASRSSPILLLAVRRAARAALGSEDPR